MKRVLLSLSTICMLFFTACEDPKAFPCEAGEGIRVTEIRTATNFKKIILDVPGDVYLTKSNTFNLEITAQQNIMDEITTDVTSDILEIRNDRCFRSYKTIRIDISLPDLELLEVKGSGDIYGMDRFDVGDLDLLIRGSGSIDLEANANSIYIDVEGSGDVNLNTQTNELESNILGSGDIFLSGVTNYHKIKLEAAGGLKAFDLASTNCDINIAASGSGEISVDSLLNVKIRGSGNVFYKGNPAINADITGSGKIISAN